MSEFRPTPPRPNVRSIFQLAAISLLIALAGGCGGGGSHGGDDDALLSVIDVQGFPDGNFFGLTPSPANVNQCIWIKFSAPVDPATLFDGTTANGLSAALRFVVSYYSMPDAAITPASPLTRDRVAGIPVLGGETNFDLSRGVFSSTTRQRVTHEDLRIPESVPLDEEHFVFVADSDGDPATIESFLPVAVGTNSARRQNAQIMVHATDALRTVRGRTLAPERTASFVVGASDRIAPMVDTTVPATGSDGHPVGEAIRIRFSESIDASSAVLAGAASAVPAINPSVNVHVTALIRQQAQPAPIRITVPGSLLPTSGQTDELHFVPSANLPGETLIEVNVYSAASTLIAANAQPPYHPAATDPSTNALAPSAHSDGGFVFRTGAGPKLANGPVAPEAIHFITMPSGMGSIVTNPLDRAANNNEDVVQELDADGNFVRVFPGGLSDGIVGDFAANLLPQLATDPPGQTRNRLNNPPRQCQYWLTGAIHRGNPPGVNVVAPGKYSAPGLADISACVATAQNPIPAPAPPLPNWCPEELTLGPTFRNIKPGLPYGNCLFVTNEARNVVHVINSNSYQVMKDIPTPDPRGLGISPDLSLLFVSNFGSGRLSVLDITGGPDGLPRGNLIKEVVVGRGPQGVAVQPGGEDVLVCNRLEKTVSVIAISQLGSDDPVRLTMQSSDPYEVHCGPRVPAYPYWAYITNPGTGEVSIFESGPKQINGFGRDQVRDVIGNLPAPTGICGDQWFNTTPIGYPVPSTQSITGAFVAMNGDGTVRHLKLEYLSAPLLPNPPDALVVARFVTGATYRVGDRCRDVCVDNNILYCVTPDAKDAPYRSTATPITQRPSRLYATNGDGTISVVEIASGREVLRLPPVGANRVFGYFKQ